MRTLVTGGNGHLGHNLVAALLARGQTVRVTIRSLANEGHVARLRALGDVDIREADIRNAAQMRDALADIDVLFHAAAVFATADTRRDHEMLETAIAGTEVTLRAAAARGVRRVIMTSSTVTLPLTRPGAPPSTEDDWNPDLRIAYIRAKVESERRAWALAEELGLQLTTILPTGIIGPGFARSTPSINIVIAARMGAFRLGTPTGTFTFGDVRDIAEAHCLALEREATGRFIVGYDYVPTYDELVRAIGRVDPRVKPPLVVLPTWLAWTLPWVDSANHTLLGSPRLVTPEAVASVLSGMVFNHSTARAQRELGWRARIPFEQSLRDTIQTLEGLGLGVR